MLRILVVVLLLAGCSSAPSPQFGRPQDGQLLSVPLDSADPTSPVLNARICAPNGSGPWPLAMLTHGSAPTPALRGAMQPASCDAPSVRWFTAQHYLVISLMRRGFGASTGPVVEDNGPCLEPDYLHSGEMGAEDITAGLRAGFALSWVKPTGALVVGQSTGGWAALAFAGRADSRVRAVIAFAPGRGAKAHKPPDTICRADLLRRAAHEFGAHAAIPVLWIAARNDSYFPPDITTALHHEFTQAGGRAELSLTNSFFDEGHALFNAPGGSDVWGAIVLGFLSRSP